MKHKIKYIFLFIIIILAILGASVYASDNDIVIVLDPGHGGDDPGATNGKYIESEINWKIANYVKEELDKVDGIKTVLTRTKNGNPELAERGLIARNNLADLMISFHINSSDRTTVRGTEVYITCNKNNVRFNEYSYMLGQKILRNLHALGIPYWGGLEPKIKLSTDGEKYLDGSMSDWYGIIRNPMYYGIPSILVEHCFISNRFDLQHISSDANIKKLAMADAKAIIEMAEKFRIDRTNNKLQATVLSVNVSNNKNGNYIYGEISITEKINDMKRNPIELPTVTLKSTDGKISSEIFINYLSGSKYYFDKFIDDLDTNKQYIIEVKSNNKLEKLISNTAKASITSFSSSNSKYKVTTNSNKIKINSNTYVGNINSEIKSLKLGSSNKNAYIYGEIIIVEWVNGKSTVPSAKPIIKLKSTDGKANLPVFVTATGTNTYYFDRFIEGIDTSKQYVLEVSSGSSNNTSKNKTMNVYFKNQNIGNYHDYKLYLNNNQIKFKLNTYVGNINSEIKSLKLGSSNKNAYIYGEIIIVEWVNGKSTVPSAKPIMRLKSTDGKANLPVFVTATGTNTYYFDRFIEGIDTSKQYVLEVSSGSNRNTSKNKTMNVYFKKQNIGKYHNYSINCNENKIKFTK